MATAFAGKQPRNSERKASGAARLCATQKAEERRFLAERSQIHL
jgi:hypothetical protein